ncbi:MAG: 5-(carboxyamino)imidazole ribonucleotide mutase [Clostridia bacterium]
MSKKVAVIMGSDSDFEVVSAAIKQLKAFEIPVEAHVMSAHRTPERASAFAAGAKAAGFGVIIAAAGMAAHLAGVLAANTTLPVIGIPIRSTFEGMDALLATVQMPSGIPVATVAVNGAKNAALLAAQILALGDPALDSKLEAMKSEMADGVAQKDAALQEKIQQL